MSPRIPSSAPQNYTCNHPLADQHCNHMKRIARTAYLLLLSGLLNQPGLLLAQAQQPAPAPVPMPYWSDNRLATTDSIELPWKDASRNREVPSKAYFPAEGVGPFPIVLFSHGLGGTRENYEYLGRQWAASGYVCIHLQHPGSDDSAWKGQNQPIASMTRAASFQNAVERDKDAKFALDQLELLNTTDGRLKGKLDLKSIGLAGHSFGAQTTLMLAGQKLGGVGPLLSRLNSGFSDDRMKAAIPMSAPVPANKNSLDQAFASIKIPIFYMTGTLDDSPIGETTAGQRRMLYDHTRSPATYLLTLAGGDHMTFSGRAAPRKDMNDQTHQKLIRIASTAFWDAYLKNDAVARKWLNESGLKQLLGTDGVFEQK